MWSPLSRLAALATLGALYFSPVTAQTWDSIRHSIRKRFPGVRQISTESLAQWLVDTNRIQPVVVDVRTRPEYVVSHLRSAHRATTVAAVRALGLEPAQPLVVYCSVGYRSSALAEKLQKAGFQAVYNLEGSIFAWANEGRPVFAGTNQVSRVHPYDAKWGLLLKEPLRARP